MLRGRVGQKAVLLARSGGEVPRQRRYQAPLITLSHATDVPRQRPTLSNDYLAGAAPEDWIPLETAEAAIEVAPARFGQLVVGISNSSYRVVGAFFPNAARWA